MPQAKRKGKAGNIRYETKITVEVTGKIPKRDLRDLLQTLGATPTAKLENGR